MEMDAEANIQKFREDVLAMARVLRTCEEDAKADQLADARKHIVMLQQQVQSLQIECMQLRNRLRLVTK